MSDQTILEFIEEASEEFRNLLNSLTYVQCQDLGLDVRAGYGMWVCEDCIVIEKGRDNSLQYYGGFEYVDKEYRKEFGDYVIYLAEDSRVAGHLDSYYCSNSDNPIVNSYPDGKCPECYNPIPRNAHDGSECPECGFVFCEERDGDD